MIKGIGAIPHNLIIKSGGYTYYPLNQFEIDGTVSVDLYRQDSEGNKIKMFSFKGEKDELKTFKKKFPIIEDKKTYTNYFRTTNDPNASNRVNIHPTAAVYKLAENLNSEAATFNKKIKTGGKLTLNESIAAGKKMLLKTNEIKYTDKPANKIVVGDYIENGNSSFKVQNITESTNAKDYLVFKGFGQMVRMKKNSIITTYTKKRDHSIQDIKPKSMESKKITPAQKKVIKPEWDKMQKFLNPKPASKKSFTLADYKKNEAINDHSLNALRLVEKFGTAAELAEIRQIRMRHNIKGSISYEDQKRRDEIANKYYKKLLPAAAKPTVKKAKLSITVTTKKGETVTKAKLAKTVKAAVNKASYTQTGKTNVKFDKLVQAKAPGKRVSKTGRKYTETRANRSDKGKWL